MSARNNSDDPISVELKFYATFREEVGQKSLTRELPAQSTLAEAIADVAEEYPSLEGRLLGDDGEIRDSVRALKNGRESAEADTVLEDGDDVSFVNPIHGGSDSSVPVSERPRFTAECRPTRPRR
ncbi:ubiquitin-like small modifier protein 1 [Halorussus ruber]|uniref:ubiquitin-like small modifier protein 1 n=1 Tax=Halorussus ruber TaxID=1126238 RepID=UPI001B2FF960|nr:ubiquitin-like small modifier protein 1 [Halorussus ruber]